MREVLAWVALGCTTALGSTVAVPTRAAQPAGAAGAQAWPVGEGLRADPDIRFGVLANGMRYAIRRNATPPGDASLRLWIGAGSLAEAEDQRGLAHFLEHMVLNGTKNVPEGEFIRRLERAGLRFGPDTNASTSFDATTFMLELPQTDSGTIDTALFLFREVADKALLDPAAIERERGIILSEERARATPGFRQMQHELAFLYPGQLLPTRLPIGTTEVIRGARRQRFLDFYNAYYRPENAVLVAVGDFDVEEMEQRIRRQFADWKGEGPPGAAPAEGQPASRGPDAAVYVDPAASNRVTLTWVRPADTSPDSRAVRIRDMLEAIALAVINRRFSRLAATDDPPFVAATAGEGELVDTAETTQVSAAVRPRAWRRALAIIDQEQRRFRQHGITEAELQREITGYRAGLEAAVAAAGTRTSPALANAIVGSLRDRWTITTPEDRLALFNQAVQGLTAQKVNAVIPRLFNGSGPLVYLASPVPIEGDRQALLSAYQETAKVAVGPPVQQVGGAWPYTGFGRPGTVAERQHFPTIGATAVRFANGVRLVVRPSQQRKEQILVRVRVGDGRLDFKPGEASPEWALPAAFTLGGTGKLTADDMNEVLTGKQVSGGFAVTDDRFLIQGSTRPVDFATQMQLLAAYLTDPGWRPTGWERMRSLAGTIQNQLASTPGGVFNRDAGALLRGGDRRWATPTLAQMESSRIDQARALLAGPMNADPLEVIVVGDISVDEAIRQTAVTFGALPPRSAARAAPPPLTFPAGGTETVTLTHKGREDQGIGFIGWRTQGFHADPATARTLDLLGAVYQLRLNDRFREAEGVTYSPQAGHSASDVFDGFGYFFGRIEAAPADLPRFFGAAQEIADSLRDRPVTDDELVRARRPLLEQIQRVRAGNEWWLGELGDLGRDPRVPRAIETQVSDLQAVTPASLQAAARRFLRPDAAYRLVVVPEKRAATR